jgi:hypothetical protein
MRDHEYAVRLWESLGFTILAIARKLSDILTVGSSAFTSCTGSCD